jgi:hypothetical protein
MNLPNPLAKRKLEPTLPTNRAIEAEFADYVPRQHIREVALSQKMERDKDLLANGLTDAYETGAKALAAAIDEADQQQDRHEQIVAQKRRELDDLKRKAGEYLLAHKSTNAELAAGVEAHLDHLRTMARWVEEQHENLKHPPQPPRPALGPPQPLDDHHDEPETPAHP